MKVSILFLLICVTAAAVFADTAIFMQLSGITGESIDAIHNGWIDVTAFSHGVSHSGGSQADHANLNVTYVMDKSAPVLNIRACDQQNISEVVVEVTQTGDTSKEIYTVTLTDAKVTYVQTSGSASLNSVSVSFSYGSIEWQYTPYDAGGIPQTPVTACWDVTSNTACP